VKSLGEAIVRSRCFFRCVEALTVMILSLVHALREPSFGLSIPRYALEAARVVLLRATVP
jgi:hypothetical protein